jgi:hypothetical protein
MGEISWGFLLSKNKFSCAKIWTKPEQKMEVKGIKDGESKAKSSA